MSAFEHSRFEIWSQTQHPYKHTLSDFGYSNPALPGSTNVETALNWIFKVLYPNTMPAVATPGDLPLAGNTLNDYRVVLDDGDGKQAGYRWEQREGDVAPLWYKIFDFDWSTDAILAAFQDITNDTYVIKHGRQDLDSNGDPITGVFAGQRIWGGTQSGDNLTLDANSADDSGYVQVNSNFRPVSDDNFSLGTSTERFSNGYFAFGLNVAQLSMYRDVPNNRFVIQDTQFGTLDFIDNTLVTTASIYSNDAYFADRIFIGAAQELELGAGSIRDTSGQINFDSTNLITTGTVTGAANSVFGDITLGTGTITSASPDISFGANNLTTTGTLQAGNATVTRLDADNVRLDGNALSIVNANGNLIVQANGTGIVDVQSALQTLGITATGTVAVTGQFNIDNLRFDGNVISSTNLNGDVQVTPNGSGSLVTTVVRPSSDNVSNLGQSANRYARLFLGTAINDGTNEISSATLMSLRGINSGVSTGMSLFWDGTQWTPSTPDTEITHSTVGGLTTGDAGHTQFAMLAGRSGGQTIQGGTGNGENLVLDSTSSATKGNILTAQTFLPQTTASYSGSWAGLDLGSSSFSFRDLYTKGELKGARLENFTFAGLPGSSGQNIGRMAFVTDQNKVYVDTGTQWVVAGASKFVQDVAFNGAEVSKTVTVSSAIQDARNAIWALKDNANNFEQIYASIYAISATQVQVVVNTALPAGSYRLIGIE